MFIDEKNVVRVAIDFGLLFKRYTIGIAFSIATFSGFNLIKLLWGAIKDSGD